MVTVMIFIFYIFHVIFIILSLFYHALWRKIFNANFNLLKFSLRILYVLWLLAMLSFAPTTLHAYLVIGVGHGRVVIFDF